MRKILPLLFSLLTFPALAQSLSSSGATSGAPTNAHYYTNQAEAGLSAEVVPAANVITLLGSADNAAMRTNLGLVIGTNVQAFDADLSSWAAITRATGWDTLVVTPSSANLNAALTDETGTGALVFATSPTLVTPILGTPTSGTATNLTGLPISSGLTGAGTGVLTALGVNVGSAGAPVLFNGAGGTPSSLTLTNATGLPNASVIGLGTAAVVNTGTSGATIPLLNGVNTFAVGQRFGTPSSALTTNAASADVYTASTSLWKFAAEDTTASSSTRGAFIGLFSNDGAALASGDRMGGFLFGGSESASVVGNGTTIAGFATQTWASGSHGSRLGFSVVPNTTTTAVERLGIEQSGLISFGGSTSSFPALKRNGAGLDARLADDSAYAPLAASLYLGGDGAVGGPTFSFVNDPNTGLYSVGADALEFVTGGTGRFRINSSGNIIFVTDAANDLGSTNNFRPRDLFLGRSLVVEGTVTAGGTTGAQTINKASGTVNFAAAATTLVVMNSLVTTNSIVLAVVRTADATATIKSVVPASGSFTITLGAAATAETSVGFFVVQPE